MARSRNLKPGFFKNDQLAECGAIGMVTFAGLWCIADCNGNLEHRPRRIKAEVIPYFEDDIEEILLALAARGFIQLYGPTGDEYLHIVNFEKHQNPHKKEKDAGSDIPEPELFRERPGQDQVENGDGNALTDPPREKPGQDPENPGIAPDNPDLAGLIPSSPFPPPDSRETPPAAGAASSSPNGDDLPAKSEKTPYRAVLNLYHQMLPDLPMVKVMTNKRKAALRQRHTSLMQRDLEQWRAYFRAVAASDFLMGRIDGKTWRADFDFLLTEKAMTGVIENKYDALPIARQNHGCQARASPTSTRETTLQEDLADTGWATQ